MPTVIVIAAVGGAVIGVAAVAAAPYVRHAINRLLHPWRSP